MWYAVCHPYNSYEEGSERDGAAIWTVSRSPTETGWNTDSGYGGYGLTLADAQFLADAANAAEAKT